MDIRIYNPPPEREWAVESDSEFQPLFLLTHPKFFFFFKADSGEFVILKICYFQLICLPTTLVKLILLNLSRKDFCLRILKRTVLVEKWVPPKVF